VAPVTKPPPVPAGRPSTSATQRNATSSSRVAVGDITVRPAFWSQAAVSHAAARDAVLARRGWDAAGQGLVGAPPVTVVVGGEVHAAVRKALGLVGLGRDRAVVLPVDAQGRIVAAGLPALAPPAIVCLQAGNVNSGASDPFGPLIAWARDAGAWVHVDGAFGLWAAAAPGIAAQVAGVAEADSWATDAHKWLNTTYDCGIVLVRDPAALSAALTASAAYLPDSADREPSHFTPQSSQRARGIEVWATLAALGRDGVADLVEQTCRLAWFRRAQRRGAQPGGRGLRRRRTDRRGHWRRAAGRHLLVRPDHVAGTARDADQRQRLEHHRGGHRRQRRRHPRLRGPVRDSFGLTPP
jgi:hypothetical protein